MLKAEAKKLCDFCEGELEEKIMIISFALFWLCGCQSAIFSHLFSEQSWSENYALEDNVECSSSLMVDGSVETIGETAVRDIFLVLPQKKSIHRIVLRDTNVKDLVIYASTGAEGSWKRVGKASNNQRSTLEVRISPTATSKFRFTVMATREDQLARGEYSYDVGRITGYIKRAPTKIGELELYGFAPKEDLRSSTSNTPAQ